MMIERRAIISDEGKKKGKKREVKDGGKKERGGTWMKDEQE